MNRPGSGHLLRRFDGREGRDADSMWTGLWDGYLGADDPRQLLLAYER